MDKSVDRNVSKRVKAEMDKYQLSNFIIAGIININASSFNDILTGKSPWRLAWLARIAEYLGKSLDYFIFGDEKHIEKLNKTHVYNLKKDIREYLIKEKKYEAYGKLTADGFFDELDKT